MSDSTKPTYRVIFNPSAWNELMDLPEKMQGRILTAIESLEVQPRRSGVVKLQDFVNTYRVRVGDYRIVYEIQDAVLVVVVVKVGNRRDVYR